MSKSLFVARQIPALEGARASYLLDGVGEPEGMGTTEAGEVLGTDWSFFVELAAAAAVEVGVALERASGFLSTSSECPEEDFSCCCNGRPRTGTLRWFRFLDCVWRSCRWNLWLKNTFDRLLRVGQSSLEADLEWAAIEAALSPTLADPVLGRHIRWQDYPISPVLSGPFRPKPLQGIREKTKPPIRWDSAAIRTAFLSKTKIRFSSNPDLRKANRSEWPLLLPLRFEVSILVWSEVTEEVASVWLVRWKRLTCCERRVRWKHLTCCERRVHWKYDPLKGWGEACRRCCCCCCWCCCCCLESRLEEGYWSLQVWNKKY